MTHTTPVALTTTPFAKYAASLLPFFILLTVGLQAVAKAPNDWTVIVPFLILVLGGVVSYIVKLLPVGWQGRTKVVVTAIAAVVASLIPFITPGGFDSSVDIFIVLNAVLQTLSVQLGVDIRTSPVDRGLPALGRGAVTTDAPPPAR